MKHTLISSLTVRHSAGISALRTLIFFLLSTFTILPGWGADAVCNSAAVKYYDGSGSGDKSWTVTGSGKELGDLSTLYLKGFWLKIDKNDGNVCENAILHYSVDGGVSGTLTKTTPNNWYASPIQFEGTGDVNLMEGLAPGVKHTLSLWYEGHGGSSCNSIWYSNNGSNYKMTFTYVKTINDLVVITDDFIFEPTAALTNGVLYADNHLLSLGGSGFSTNPNRIQIKKNRQIAFKVNAGATVTVSYVTNSSRIMQMGTTYNKENGATDAGTSTDGTLSHTFASASTVYLSASEDLYITQIQVSYATPHSITYDCDGATGGCPEDVASATKLPNPLPTPAKTGYNFVGWYTNSAKTIAAVAGATLNANTTLYAKWEIVQYTITYVWDGGACNDGYTAPTYYTVETAAALPARNEIHKDGYGFVGWYIDAEHTDRRWVGYGGNTDNTGNKTLYAYWVNNTQITLDANTNNHGKGTNQKVEATYALGLPSFTHCTPAWGYALEGYYTTASGEGDKVINSDGSLVASVEPYTDSYSHWKYIENTATLYARYEWTEPEPETLFSADVTRTSSLSVGAGADYSVVEADATITGGTVTIHNGQKDAKNLIAAANGRYGFAETNSNTYLKIELTEPLAVGDLISADIYSATGSNLGIFITTLSSRPNSCSSAITVAASDPRAWTQGTYRIQYGDGLAGASTIYIYRADNSTTQYFDNLTIIRDGNIPVCSAPTNITISGGWHVFEGERLRLTAAAENVANGATYTWKHNGETLAGQTTNILNINPCTADDAGSYTCTISNGDDCEASSDAFNVKLLRLLIKDGDSEIFHKALVKGSDNTASISVELNGDHTYSFRITDGCGGSYGNSGTMSNVNCTDWVMNANADCHITTTKQGTYTFNVNYSTITAPVVSVAYPAANQAASKDIYFDNNMVNWSNLHYRIGRNDHNLKTAMTLVPGTANLYKVTTSVYDNFLAWHIANGAGDSDGNSVFKTKSGSYAITNATAFNFDPVTSEAITITPTSSHATGVQDVNDNCQFYTYQTIDGMKINRVNIIAEHGTITVSYTDVFNQPQSFNSGSQVVAHTCIIQASAVAEAGYKLNGLYIDDEPYTAHTNYTVAEEITIRADISRQTDYSMIVTATSNTDLPLNSNVVGATVTGGTMVVTRANKDNKMSILGLNKIYGIYFSSGNDEVTVTLADDKVLLPGSVITGELGFGSTQTDAGLLVGGVTIGVQDYTKNEYGVFEYIVPEGSPLIGLNSFVVKRSKGTGTYLRKFEIAGVGDPCTLSAPKIIATAEPTYCPISYPVKAVAEDGSDIAGGSYQWFKNGTSIPAATAATYTITEEGDYYVEYTDMCTVRYSNSIHFANKNPEVHKLSPFQYHHMDSTYADTDARHLFAVKSFGTTPYTITAIKNENMAYTLPTGAVYVQAGGGEADTLMLNRSLLTDLNNLDSLTITVTPVDACNTLASAYANSIKVYAISKNAKKNLAFIITGANGDGTKNKGSLVLDGDFISGINKADLKKQTSQTAVSSEELPLYTMLKRYYNVTPVNGYAPFCKYNYEPFDLLFLTDFVKTDGSANASAAKKKVNELGLLVDYRPIFTTKCHMSGISNWEKVGFIANPVVPKQTQKWMNITCYAHPMFDAFKEADVPHEASNGEVVFTMADRGGFDVPKESDGGEAAAKAVQGFTMQGAANFVTVAVTHYNAQASIVDNVVNPVNVQSNDELLVASCERQANPEARLLMLSINADAHSFISEQGLDVIHLSLEYLLDSRPVTITDCSITFDNGKLAHNYIDGTTGTRVVEITVTNALATPELPAYATLKETINNGDSTYKHTFTYTSGNSKWNNPANWNAGIVPTSVNNVRIVKPVTIDTPAEALTVKICHNNNAKNEDGSTDVSEEGHITITPTGSLSTKSRIYRVEQGKYVTFTPTHADDVLIETNAGVNGALIHGDIEGNTSATIEFYSISNSADGSGNDTPNWQWMATPFNDVSRAIQQYYYAWVTEFVNEEHAWTNIVHNEDPMYPFHGYAITQDTRGKAGLTYVMNGVLAPTADQTLSLAYKNGNGINLIGNSWTAPINITQWHATDFVNATATIVMFNTGRDVDGTGTEITPGTESRTAATYVSVPVETTSELPAALQVIPSMQAFQVKATGANASLKMNYEQLVRPASGTVNHQALRAPQRSAQQPQLSNGIGEKLRINLLGQRYSDFIYLFQHDGCTDGFDNGWDGEKIYSDNYDIPVLYIENQVGDWQISTQPSLAGTHFGFYKGEDDNYAITFEYIGYETLYLYDANTDIYTPVHNDSVYHFSSNTFDLERRFMLTDHNPYAPFIPEVPTGIMDLEEKQDGLFFTNTTGEQMFIHIYDPAGRLCFSESTNAPIYKAVLPDHQGVYMVDMKTATRHEVKKVVR